MTAIPFLIHIVFHLFYLFYLLWIFHCAMPEAASAAAHAVAMRHAKDWGDLRD